MTVTEHTFALPDGREVVLDTATRYCPPMVVTVEGVRYLTRPACLGAVGRQTWRLIPL